MKLHVWTKQYKFSYYPFCLMGLNGIPNNNILYDLWLATIYSTL